MRRYTGKQAILDTGEQSIRLDGKLTMQPATRRKFDGRRRFVLFVAIVATIAVLAGANAEPRMEFQAIADIESAAASYIRQRLKGNGSAAQVEASPLDQRIRLARCDQPLQAFLRPGTRVAARTIVGVRCVGSKPWKVYVPVNLVITADVLIPKRTLPKGHLITAEDLAADRRDVSRLQQGYYSSPAALVGQRVALTITAGRVITPRMVEADKVIRRGQSVTLIASSGGLRISMSGKALSDGALHQRIEVRNDNSGRIVEGIVRSREHVEVLTAANSGNFSEMPKVSAPVADIRHSNNDR